MKEEIRIIAPRWSANAGRWLFGNPTTTLKQQIEDDHLISDHLAQNVYRQVWRFDFAAPGFCLIDVGGVEPSNVRSQLLMADYARAAFDLDLTPKQLLEEVNPMHRAGEEQLAPYVTELPQPALGQARILVINNSSLPFTEERRNPLGVMHKATIDKPHESERRVVNSMLITLGEADQVRFEQQQEEFVATDMISKKCH
ncbi:hypothetical protein [Roseimaritima sediminicola]|uniref:hypothetical protein n=1 Tax=Roseimaritima sediminicola TaxID=2662066 RepID=UPI0012982418|nr:hypothetical protein [Roseimaritima sediminicola]